MPCETQAALSIAGVGSFGTRPNHPELSESCHRHPEAWRRTLRQAAVCNQLAQMPALAGRYSAERNPASTDQAQQRA
ncbi:TPA: hypothetical protein OND26_003579 [Enterobacter kobei]|nr:hypothetical protein [Enterobacter kobei]